MSSFWTGDVGRHRKARYLHRFFVALQPTFVKCGSCYDADVFLTFGTKMYKAYVMIDPTILLGRAWQSPDWSK